MKKEEIVHLPMSRFHYDLPDEKIARYPLPQRDASRLLLYGEGEIGSATFGDLPDLLPEDSLLLFNNTRVIHARLLFRKPGGAQVEIFCLTPSRPADYAISFQQRHSCSWYCMTGNARRWREGVLVMTVPTDLGVVALQAERVARHGSETEIRFSWDDDRITFSELLDAAGKLPIPPYLNRPTEEKDEVTYQTVYSRIEGSVAAPTAGLHFTQEVMERLQVRGIQTDEVTLHVGAGTFRPVKSETIADHEMHTEFISVERETIEALLHHQGKLIVVGTTSLRTVESLYYIGRKLYDHPDLLPHQLTVGQWEPYEEVMEIAPADALRSILSYLERTGEKRLMADTQIIIAPGYRFHYPDALITNFHQPQSTLLLLVAAFVGEEWKRIYDCALQEGFRFLSYGDSSLLWKKMKEACK
ncbi:MAG: S-adenosylmethionine:tRNA ribosyltransferase-isomerase [bacterium]|nr:S-adenosylmethionine:tRNA ribosyltransferase-isomerase [bacterium]MDD3967939.1 S-adenosylmethionine:tRNA ribosyltransferase-isomerase [Proteiniphilum sp.]MDD4459268.1 S-adenosylmethionine:tRNA ribosyltransferase-isomerase [Proteiniphilum sp.]